MSKTMNKCVENFDQYLTDLVENGDGHLDVTK